MLSGINSWFENISGIIEALAAVSTTAAVIISLRLARISHRPKLDAHAYVGVTLYPTGNGFSGLTEESKRHVTVSLKNVGPVPVTVDMFSFSWHFRGYETAVFTNPVNPPLKVGGMTIPPAEGRIVTFASPEELREAFVKPNLWFPAWRLYLDVHGSDGMKHRVSIDKKLIFALTRDP